MKNFITANLVAIVSLIGTVIIGLTSMAWKAEKHNIYSEINTEKQNRLINDSLIWNEINTIEDIEVVAKAYTDSKIVEHEKIHNEQKNQLLQIQSDLTLIKNHLINN